MNFLFLFMDGIGLGANDPENNPLARVKMPNLSGLLGGKKLILEGLPVETELASLVALDANLGVPGLPQSATGQGALVTGKNISAIVGEHYGPKPNPPVREVILADNIFQQLTTRGYRSALLNGYPPRFFEGIASGKRLLSAIPLSVTSADIALKTEEDVHAGRAFSVDFTGKGWRDQLGYADYPVKEPREAGLHLAEVSLSYDLAFFEFWVSDYAGHHQDQEAAEFLLTNFDAVLGGLLEGWPKKDALIIITSDHGNMEDLSTRKHTLNPVPGLVIGDLESRQKFMAGLSDITHVTPNILNFYPKKDH
jgi:hypothetical protein